MFKSYLKLIEVKWGYGDPFAGSPSMIRIYDIIESVSNCRRISRMSNLGKYLYWYDCVRYDFCYMATMEIGIMYDQTVNGTIINLKSRKGCTGFKIKVMYEGAY